MEIGCLDCYTPLETALKRVGYKVDEVEKKDKKTVITVSRGGESDKNVACLISRTVKRRI